MASNEFYAKSIAFILLLNFVFVTYPAQTTQLTGLDTGAVSASDPTEANVSGTTNVANVGGITATLSTLFNIYTSAESSNRILQAIFSIYAIIAVRDLVLDLGWIG